MVDHLFRHHYGRMVATLVKVFGINNLDLIEDVVQDVFIKALSSWKHNPPTNPAAWLTQAAKNRAIDLIRKNNSEKNRMVYLNKAPKEELLDDMFLDYQIEDSQLRMIFTACHPELDIRDQIAFALKTIAGFSDKEIATSLLLKTETVKKRLSRARKKIKSNGIAFNIPDRAEISFRVKKVFRVLYLIFNEGYHSTHPEFVIRNELCQEAIRLISLILKKPYLRSGEGYALLGLFAFNGARLTSKINNQNLLISLRDQDRNTWDKELIALGNAAMNKAVQYEDKSEYHLEALIASEHIHADSFEATNWRNIYQYYLLLYNGDFNDFNRLNLAFILIQLDQMNEAYEHLESIDPNCLGLRTYLYFGVLSEYYFKKGNKKQAIQALQKAIDLASNKSEKKYLQIKFDSMT